MQSSMIKILRAESASLCLYTGAMLFGAAKLKFVVIKLTSDSRTLYYRTMLYSGKRGKKEDA